MDVVRDYHTKWSSYRKINIMGYHLYVESNKMKNMKNNLNGETKKKKKDTNELIYKTEIDP